MKRKLHQILKTFYFAILFDICISNAIVSAAVDPVQTSANSSTSLRVTWSNISNSVNESITGYQIFFGISTNCSLSNSSEIKDYESLIINATDVATFNDSLISYVIPNLKKWTCYQVKVSVILETGGYYGKNSTVQLARTSEDAPTAAPANFTVVAYNSSSLELRWLEPDQSKIHGIIRSYTIRYLEVNCTDGTKINDSVSWNKLLVDANERSFVLSSLSFWSCYDVEIAAVTIAEGPFANQKNARTNEHAPTAAPGNFTTIAYNSSSLQLNWLEPDQSKTHGNIRNYTIRYQEVNCTDGTAISNSLTEVTVDADVKSTIIDNLSFWSCYGVQIAAVTVAEGPFATVKNVRTNQHAPTASPRNFTAIAYNPSSLKLNWLGPEESQTHGIIRNYTIQYQEVNCTDGAVIGRGLSLKKVTVDAGLKSTIIDNLSFWSCYGVQIAAVTVAEGPFTTVKTVRTKEHAPTASPRNFTAIANNSSSLKLDWLEPDASQTNGIVRNYNVLYQEVNCADGTTIGNGSNWNNVSVEADARSTVINKLSFWSCYDIKIAAFTVGQGPFAKAEKVRTSEHAPTDTPRNFTATAYNASSLQLNWLQPDPSQTHGTIRNYTIRYQEVNCTDGAAVGNSVNNVTVDAGLQSTVIDNLSFWSCYDVEIAAFTVGEGPFAYQKNVRTSQHAPTAAPRNFTAIARNSSSLQLNWLQPDPSETHGIIRSYAIRYQEVNCTDGIAISDNTSWKKFTVEAGVRSTTIDNLLFWSCYDIEIAAVTVGAGQFASQKKIRTNENAPTAAPRNFSVVAYNSSSLQLNWLEPDSLLTHGIVRNYTIRYQEVNCTDGTTMSDSVSWKKITVEADVRSKLIDNLSFWSCYDVEIAAATVGQGPFATERKVRTNEHAPTGTPLNFTAIAYNSSSLQLNWLGPDASKTHGIIRNYTIRYQEVNCTDGTAIGSGISWNKVTVEAAARSTVIDNLSFWSCYDVEIAAFTVGEGPFVTVKNVRTKEHAPTATPRKFSAVAYNSTSLQLNWLEPNPSQTHGIIRNYTIQYQEVNCTDGTAVSESMSWNKLTVDSNERSLLLNSLSFWSCYDVEIAAVTVSQGPFVSEKNVRTKEHAPTAAPGNFTITNVSSSSLQLNWTAPPLQQTHGIIRKYLIRYKTVDCDTGIVIVENANWTTISVNPDMRSFLLGNLSFWSCYDVEVAAFTVATGPFVGHKTRKTSENAPTAAPEKFQVRNSSSSSLELIWEPPPAEQTHGFIRHYLIRYKIVQCNADDVLTEASVWQSTTVESSIRSFNLTSLEFWTCYNVNISAVTVGEGPFATKRAVRTSEHAPTAAPRNISAVNTSSTSLLVNWTSPIKSKLHGFVRYYLIKYREVDCDTGYMVNSVAAWKNKTVGANVYHLSLTELSYWSCYDVNISAVTVGKGPSARLFKVRTSEHAPTAAPRNISAVNTTSTILLVNWTSPMKSRLHGFVRYYLIKYREVDCDTGDVVNSLAAWKNQTVGANVYHLSLTELSYWTCYDVNISAVTVGEGPSVRLSKVRTSEHAPTAAPRNISAVNTSSTSLLVNWTLPIKSKLHGFVRYCLIKYREVDCATGDVVNSVAAPKNQTVGANVYHLSLTELSYWTCYDVNISAVTVGEGPSADLKKVRTSEHAPTAAPRNVIAVNTSSTSLLVNWTSPFESKLHGFIRYYLIKYKEVDCDTGDVVNTGASWNTKTVAANVQHVSLGELSYWKCYDVNVSAVTVGEGPFRGLKKVRTSEHAPTAAPEEFKVTNSSSSSLELTWNPPSTTLTHGFIRHYLIKYKVVHCNAASSLNDASDWQKTTVASNVRSLNLTKLKFWTCYDVNISAVTVGEGPFATKRAVRTSEHAPTKPPSIIDLTNASSTSLFVKWNDSAVEFQHGIIRGYRVSYQEVSCNTSDSSTTPSPVMTSTAVMTTSTTKRSEGTTSNNPEPTKNGALRRFKRGLSLLNSIESVIVYGRKNTTIPGLKIWTCYSVYVICWTVAESGKSVSKIKRTTEDKPEAPLFTSCIYQSSTEIKVTWEEPKKPNGWILNYMLSWKYNRTVYNNDNRNGERVVNAAARENAVSGLQIYSFYIFTLQARTSAGSGLTTSIECRTNHSNPTEPTNLEKTVKSAWEIEIKWQKPLYFNGVFFYYKIIYTNTKTSEVKTIENIKTTSYSFKSLNPCTTYEFNVFCVASGGISQAAFISATTEISSPMPPTGIPPTAIEPSITDVTFTVKLQNFSSSNGPIKYYWIVVYDMAGGTPKNPDDYLNSDFKQYESREKGFPYITANLKVIPRDGIFTIGDGKSYSNSSTARKRRSTTNDGFTNGRLNADSDYKVFQRAFVSDNHYSSSSWYGPYRTGPTPTKPPSVAGPVAGGVVAVLIIFALVGGYYIYRKRRLTEKPVPPEIPILQQRVVGEENLAFEDPIPVDEFEQYCQRLNQNGGYQMSEQFKTIRETPMPPAEHSRHPINVEKNRYNNIWAFDHTRVKLLRVDDSPESEYINANYIDGYGQHAAYIACQGPLDTTREDFWRMMWEQEVSIIVMVTRCEEKERIKCSQYWPLSGSLTFGTIQVSVSESTELPDFNSSVLSLLYSREPGKEKFIRHFHYLSWPDHGVPAASSLLSFLRRVNENTPPDPGPIVVHCSAGVGRTGTYIVLDVNMKRIAAENNIDVFNYLRTIRRQRNYLVQTEGQYSFIYDALLEHIKCGYTEILAKDLRDYIKYLHIRVSDEEIKLDREFQKLNELAQNNDKTFKAAHMMCNKGKNRFFNILPYDDTRVQLRMIAGAPGSDYINANYIDGYQYTRAFIATQAPLPNTVDDFWRMVYEQQCPTIVCLIKDSESARTKLHHYWPEDEVQKSGPLLIEKLKQHEQMDFIIRDFKLTNSQRGNSRILRHFQFTAWPDSGMPENGAGLVDFIGQVQKWQQQSGNSKVIVHCSTGVGRTGVFIALVNLIERLKTENVVNVFQAVRKLRNQRPAMVQTKGQYMFCYIALQDYLASFDIYSNFM